MKSTLSLVSSPFVQGKIRMSRVNSIEFPCFFSWLNDVSWLAHHFHSKFAIPMVLFPSLIDASDNAQV
jgi:hypothetical protein